MRGMIFRFVAANWGFLLAIPVVAGLVFAAGWKQGSDHTTRIYAEKAEETKRAIIKKQAEEMAKAKRDYEVRLAAAGRRSNALADALKHTVVNPCKSVVNPEAMKSLNHPDLIGKRQ